MKIGIIAVGSQGDVQPYAALGAGLARHGHRVTLISHENFRPLAASCGLDFAPVAGNPMEIVQGAEGQSWLASSNRSVSFLLRLSRLARGIIDRLARDALAGSRGSDLIIYSLPLSISGYTVAESLGVPGIPAALYPLHATASFPSIMMPNFPLRAPLVNRASAALVAKIFWSVIRPLQRRWRELELELPPLSRRSPFASFLGNGTPFLYGYSPSVIPRPADWKEILAVCGYWFLDRQEGWKPPTGLLEFIEAGPPPLYIGFGSMASGDPKATARVVLEALARSGQRALLAAGWGGLHAEDLPDTIFPVGFVPHGWLFPRMAGVVHHGGAGTTATALRAGVPQAVVPFFADQFFWGRRIAELGLGPQPIAKRRLSVEPLAEAMRFLVTDRETARRCAAMAAAIAGEDGIGTAVSVVERYFDRTTRRTMR